MVVQNVCKDWSQFLVLLAKANTWVENKIGIRATANRNCVTNSISFTDFYVSPRDSANSMSNEALKFSQNFMAKILPST